MLKYMLVKTIKQTNNFLYFKMKKRGIKKKKKGKRKICILIGSASLIILILNMIYFLKRESSKRKSQDQKQSYSHNSNPLSSTPNKQNSDKVVPTDTYKKPEYNSTPDIFNLSITIEDESSLRKEFEEKDNFLGENTVVDFGKVGFLSLRIIHKQILKYLINELDTDFLDLYLFQVPVFSFIYSKIDWTKEKCEDFSMEVRWLINQKNNPGVVFDNLKLLLRRTLELICIDIDDSIQPLVIDLTDNAGIDCFDIYKEDLVVFLDHILSNCRVIFGRPLTIIIVDTIWRFMPIEGNPYVNAYKKVIMETIGLNPFLC